MDRKKNFLRFIFFLMLLGIFTMDIMVDVALADEICKSHNFFGKSPLLTGVTLGEKTDAKGDVILNIASSEDHKGESESFFIPHCFHTRNATVTKSYKVAIFFRKRMHRDLNRFQKIPEEPLSKILRPPRFLS